MKTSEVREKFLNYFSDRDHAVLPSSPSIPHGDKTLLVTNAGMVQFKDIFTGRQESSHPRATTVQKCVRAGGKHNDLDNVGYTSRHLTLFEMLGNFSFGDYFKKEAITYAWELITEGYGLDPSTLWATVFREDDEAIALWKESGADIDGARVRFPRGLLQEGSEQLLRLPLLGASITGWRGGRRSTRPRLSSPRRTRPNRSGKLSYLLTSSRAPRFLLQRRGTRFCG